MRVRGVWWQQEGETYVFQVPAVVIFQEPVRAAELALAESAVADDRAGGSLALGERATDLGHVGGCGNGSSGASEVARSAEK